MLEKNIENKLTTAVEKAGGIAPKFVSPSLRGMPDRLVYVIDSIDGIGGMIHELLST